MNLSNQQLDIIEWESGSACVVAGAGSGKTLALVERTARLIEKGHNAENILLFTFTRKAAREITGRLVKRIGRSADAVATSTIHSLALSIFREHPDILDYDSIPTIWKPERIGKLVRELIKNEISESGPIPETDISYVGATDSYSETSSFVSRKEQENKFISEIKQRISLLLEKEAPPIPTKISGVELKEYRKKVQGIISKDPYATDFTVNLVTNVCTRILQTKIACNVMTFDDMIPAAIRILELHADNPYHSKYLHVMVDEYQDVNEQNVAFIKLLSRNSISLMSVGDDDQAIYGFRGGDTQHILRFSSVFGGTELYLTRNYRSKPEIIDLANKVISANKGRFGKTMTAHKQEKQGETNIHVIAPRGYDSQYQYSLTPEEEGIMQRAIYQKIINEIRGLVFFLEVDPTDIAILARNNFNLVQFSNVARRDYIALNKRLDDPGQLRFQMLSNIGLFKNQYINRLHNWFNFLLNKDDTISLREALMDSIKGFGDKAALHLEDAIFQNPEGDLPDWLSHIQRQPRHGVNTRKGKLIERAKTIFQSIRDALPDLTPTDIFFACFELAGIQEEMDYKRTKNLSGKETDRMESLETLLSDYRELMTHTTFESDLYGKEGLSNWMDTVQVELSEKEQMEHIALGTIHASKGKEWPYVFLIDLQNDILPSKRAEDLEEERRLLYVGMTRAEDYLYLSWFNHENKSQFLTSIQTHLPEAQP